MSSSPNKPDAGEPDAASSWYFANSPNAYRSATFAMEKSETYQPDSWHYTHAPNAYRGATSAMAKSEADKNTEDSEPAAVKISTGDTSVLETVKGKVVPKGSTPRENADGSRNVIAGVRFNTEKLRKKQGEGE